MEEQKKPKVIKFKPARLAKLNLTKVKEQIENRKLDKIMEAEGLINALLQLGWDGEGNPIDWCLKLPEPK